MFNLLMQYQPWGAGRDTFPVARFFEYTDGPVADQFRAGGDILLDKLTTLPCLFMQEGIANEAAHVGRIDRARISGRDVVLEYTFDPEIDPILNSTIFARKLEFDMPHDFEFSRGHWAVKDLDLYRVLLRLSRPQRQRPTVFSIDRNERIEPELVSVMMPFDAAFAAVYESLQAAATAAGLRCRRADDIWEAPAIIQDIVTLIDRSRVVVCDCTGRNPNVFYEAGIAHTLGREVILVTQNAGDIPFDLRHLRYIPYLNNAEGRAALAESLAARLRTIIER